nr:MAG TPA: hypothetical protein [Caudoviricetes sp.]
MYCLIILATGVCGFINTIFYIFYPVLFFINFDIY